jgi:hypothetical protein
MGESKKGEGEREGCFDAVGDGRGGRMSEEEGSGGGIHHEEENERERILHN